MMYSSKEIQYKDNAFDLLKMIGGFIVLFSHSFRHFEITKPPVSLFFTDGATGVMIFFAISGFVIMPSWEKQVGKKNSYLKFLVNRCLRIIPPLWFSFVIITLANFILKEINIFTFDYLKYAIKYCIFTYGEGYGDSGISNGVLWTILPTVVFYLFTPLIYKVMKEQKTYVWLLVIFIFWQFNVWDAQVINLFQKIPYVGSIVKASGAGFPLCFMYEFLIGSFLYFKRNTI
ncbi:MAG: acyltransferase, partial [Erysipelotrichia bacterium]|nr:acyltransferase [Erysipelotrichia bacterium]